MFKGFKKKTKDKTSAPAAVNGHAQDGNAVHRTQAVAPPTTNGYAEETESYRKPPHRDSTAERYVLQSRSPFGCDFGSDRPHMVRRR